MISLSASYLRFRSLSLSTIPIIPLFESSMAKPSPLTSRIAMHRSLLYFINHEMRARGFFPFAPNPDMPNNSAWQDWILSDGVFDNISGSFKRNSPPYDSNCCNSSVTAQPQLQFPPATTNAGGASSGGCTLALNDILAATRAMPSWKACQVEGTSWTGTAEENIQKYVSSIGIDGTGSKETSRDGSS
ncbi:hypothetical protein M378DRAFT_267851 [Amanita muscaria Koide BX008]|uniref:Uncharacterized protein n=1 Tax=Amanita muscaria (strain Koide BX008) TaxID=946122 RepID=A0A0C2TKR4_AMAMK|nr:hypothetical protein M378DRAFT_267851 [Amanita muscaria Koide BX008]